MTTTRTITTRTITTRTITTAPLPCLCLDSHRTMADLAWCLWPDAAVVIGSGPFAVVAVLNGAPNVILHPRVDDALDTKNTLDSVLAGDPTAGRAAVHRLTLEAVAVAA